MSTLPSGMIDMPLQNMSQLVGMVVMLPVDKSISAAPCGILRTLRAARLGGRTVARTRNNENLARVKQSRMNGIDRHRARQSGPHAGRMAGGGVTRLGWSGRRR